MSSEGSNDSYTLLALLQLPSRVPALVKRGVGVSDLPCEEVEDVVTTNRADFGRVMDEAPEAPMASLEEEVVL